MKCKYCEVEISPNEKICHHCGRFLGEEKLDDTKKRKRNMWIALGVIGVAVAFILTTFGGVLLNQQRTNEHLQKQVAVASANNLGMTFEEFKDNFNKNDFAMQNKLHIGDVELKKAANEATFQSILSEKLAINGLIGKLDHKILELQVIGIPSGVRDDQVRLVSTIGILIDTFSPELYDDEKRTVLKELGFDKNTDLTKANNVVVRGNVKYIFKFVKEVGYIFIVTNANRR